MNKLNLRKQVINLRKLGRTYTEIKMALKYNIPKSTISSWCKTVILTNNQKERINNIIKNNQIVARAKAAASNKIKRDKYIESIYNENLHLNKLLINKNVALIALAMLYLGEGGKHNASIMFGNSDPVIIQIFLWLLRYSYNIEEAKFRCTVQCRADQDINELQNYWSKITKIPLSQFYKAQIDPRTRGHITHKLNYKGVCRIDYFSARIFLELQQIVKTLYTGIK